MRESSHFLTLIARTLKPSILARLPLDLGSISPHRAPDPRAPAPADRGQKIGRRIILKICQTLSPSISPVAGKSDRENRESLTIEQRSKASKVTSQPARGQPKKAEADSPPTQTKHRLYAREAPNKSAGASPRPRRSPRRPAFRRHAWLGIVSLWRPQCFKRLSALLYTIC